MDAASILAAESLGELRKRIFSAGLPVETKIKLARNEVKIRFAAAELSTTKKQEKDALLSICEVLLNEASALKKGVGAGKQSRDGAQHPGTLPQIKKTKAFKPLKEPTSTRDLPQKEEIIILRSSKINGGKFWPWKTSPPLSDFELKKGEELYTDPHVLRLAPHQIDSLEGWLRAKDALPPLSWRADGGPKEPSMKAVHKIDLVQDAVSDCSVVASLCAAIARAGRGHTKLLQSVIYPYDYDNMYPLISPNGKYVVRLYFNGAYRQVEIDDRLPVSKTKRMLHVIDRRNPSLLWPALVEKAYLKVRGGYDFPGSNSGTDLLILSGWIPEQVFLHSDDTVPFQLWNRIMFAWNNGDVVITLGTGKMSPRAERELGLAALHDYAVLDLKEEDDQKLLLVKNPWCEGISWRGRTSTSSGSSTPASTHQFFAKDTDQLANMLDQELTFNTPSEDPEPLKPGTFWIDLNNVIQHYETMYLNWNPGLFKYRQDIHFSWDLSDSKRKGKRYSYVENPQLSLTCQDGGMVWVLLCRHFKGDSDSSDNPVHLEKAIDMTGYISLHVFDAGGHRVLVDDNPLIRGRYIDSPQILVKLNLVPANSKYTLVVSSEEFVPGPYTFTISAFSQNLVEVEQAKERLSEHYTLGGSWNFETAGGNAHSLTYSQNPQYSLRLRQATPVCLLLETFSSDLNVNVKLVYGNGKRVMSVTRKDIICDSGDYRRGAAVAKINDLQPGTYTVIVSTFEAGQMGDFSLRVNAMVTPELKILAREGAGRLLVKLSSAIFEAKSTCIAVPVFPKRLVRMNFVTRFLRAHTVGGSFVASRSPILLSLELRSTLNQKVMTTSENGDYSDREIIRTADVDISPTILQDTERYEMWLVLERMGAAEMIEEYEVEVLMEGVAGESVGFGHWREWVH